MTGYVGFWRQYDYVTFQVRVCLICGRVERREIGGEWVRGFTDTASPLCPHEQL